MKVLITGANGLLGHNIVLKLIAEGHEVNAIVRKAESIKVQHSKLHIFQGSFMDHEALKIATSGCHAVIHVAAATDMSLSYSEFYDTNVKGSEIVLNVANVLGIRRIVYISTLNTIGYGSKDNYATEQQPIQYPFTHSFYAQTKLMAEKMFLQAAKQVDGMNVVVINPGFMLGAYDTKPSSGQLLLAAYKKPLMATPKGGKAFVSAADVAAAVVAALECGKNGERYIAAAVNMTLKDFYKLQAKVCGYKQLLITIPNWLINAIGIVGNGLRAMGIKTQVCTMNTKQLCVKEYYSNQKAKCELNMPETPIEKAIQEEIDWLLQNNKIRSRR